MSIPCIPFPDKKFLDDFNDDVHLGLQRVAGINPITFEGLSPTNPLPENFKEVKTVVNKLTNQTYEQALKDGRLYITNYEMLKEMTENLKEIDGQTSQYTTDSIALYYRQDNGLLQPLAIQLSVTKPTGDSNPIYTPEDGQYWTMAKNYVQNADGVLAIMWTHTTHTHYMIESIIMASYRNLPPHHPLFPPRLSHKNWLPFWGRIADCLIHYCKPGYRLPGLYQCTTSTLIQLKRPHSSLL